MVYCYLLRGIAQLVACLVRDQEASGSNPDTPTISCIHKGFDFMNTRFFYFNTVLCSEQAVGCSFCFFAGGMLIKTDRVR